jgi:YidC/Oxa1 family membrane protein insertase
MTDQKNTILAIVLSGIVLVAWNYFFGKPQLDKQRQEQQLRTQAPSPTGTPQPQTAQQAQPGTAPQPSSAPAGTPAGAPPQLPGQGAAPTPGQQLTVEAVIGGTPRVQIDTPSLKGSISRQGARLDDLSLIQYRETVDPKSPPIRLFSPSRTPHPFYAEFGWIRAQGTTIKLPEADTTWNQEGSGTLGIDRPVTLVFDNGEGLEFRRTFRVDDKYMFTIEDQVANKGTAAASLHAYGLVSRHGTPQTLGYYILHEGLIGVLQDKLQEMTYSSIEEKKEVNFKTPNGWLGITDKYWAATLIPDAKTQFQARFLANVSGALKTYQTDFFSDPITIAPGGTESAKTMLFAGAKEVAVVDEYEAQYGIKLFDRLIDWGWFYFITKPIFKLIDFFFRLVGNFGVAILIVTVLVKLAFLPLANKSYASMAKMKAVQPEMMAIRERYADDKAKQQQALMELYKKEKINPLAGCLPIAIQIPVFFSLYKVLFITIEMRHAPFFGWIKDLSSPDPTNIFNLFGLIPADPTLLPVVGHFLHLGVWPLIMGVTMWMQMKLNPAPPDPTQKMIFDWMPVIFTFMLATFPAGLVIYWAWNNTLSVLQQSYIMQKHGAKVELWDNIRGTFAKKTKTDENKNSPRRRSRPAAGCSPATGSSSGPRLRPTICRRWPASRSRSRDARTSASRVLSTRSPVARRSPEPPTRPAARKS